MPFNVAAVLPELLPRAIDWAEERAGEILRTGVALEATGLAVAKSVGVARPELVRVLSVPAIPMPEDPDLRRAAMYSGLLDRHMAGLTLGYGIYIVAGHESSRLLSHECRHVHQYEAAGSIAAFLRVYLKQIAAFGYDDAPYEVDARSWERQAPGAFGCL